MDFKQMVKIYLQEDRAKFGFAPDAKNMDLEKTSKQKIKKAKKKIKKSDYDDMTDEMKTSARMR